MQINDWSWQMSTVAKSLAACAVTAAIVMSGASSAFAFRIDPPVVAGNSETNASVAAYSAETGKAAAAENWLLSPAEIAHIKWCAKKFPSYNPTDNTYATGKGGQAECRSPR
jgi:hypothetical protein